MFNKPAYELSARIRKHMDRHFDRNARTVVVYGTPNRIDCTCASVTPLGSAVDFNCQLCGGKGYIYSDSSACVYAIVTSAESRRSVVHGIVDHQQPASFHANSFVVVFKTEDVTLDPIRFPGRIVFEETGFSHVGWGDYRYAVKSYARDGIGAEDDYVKVLVEKTED